MKASVLLKFQFPITTVKITRTPGQFEPPTFMVFVRQKMTVGPPVIPRRKFPRELSQWRTVVVFKFVALVTRSTRQTARRGRRTGIIPV